MSTEAADPRNELGEFLRSRRARLRPADAEIPDFGLRRVPGLRREEVADLAGVSPSYYSRVEQGQVGSISESVLEAIATALRLDPEERAHLWRLARPTPLARRPAEPEIVSAGSRRLLERMPEVGALLIGRRTDVLAWNPLGHALLAEGLDDDAPEDPRRRPNLARMVFGSLPERARWVDWRREARDVVAYLRVAADIHPDAELAALIGELVMADPDFATLWSEHEVRDCLSGEREIRHPRAGVIAVDQQFLRLADDPGQRLLVLTPAPGESTRRARGLLEDVPKPAP